MSLKKRKYVVKYFILKILNCTVLNKKKKFDKNSESNVNKKFRFLLLTYKNTENLCVCSMSKTHKSCTRNINCQIFFRCKYIPLSRGNRYKEDVPSFCSTLVNKEERWPCWGLVWCRWWTWAKKVKFLSLQLCYPMRMIQLATLAALSNNRSKICGF